MVPVVNGALGSITKRLHSFLGLLGIDSELIHIIEDCSVRNWYYFKKSSTALRVWVTPRAGVFNQVMYF